jgi:hypothetical protein
MQKEKEFVEKDLITTKTNNRRNKYKKNKEEMKTPLQKKKHKWLQMMDLKRRNKMFR